MRTYRQPGFLAVMALALAAVPGHAMAPGHGPGDHATGPPAEHITATHPERYAFQVTPARLILPPASGTETRTFTVADLGQVPLPMRISIAQYSQQPNGTTVFQPPGPLSAVGWVRVSPAALVVQAGTMRTVTVRITVPPHPGPGERYLAVIFRTPPQGEHDGRHPIAVSGAVAAEMLVNVPGPVKHKIALVGLAAPGFSTGGAIPLTVTVHNLGTVHQLFAGQTALTARYGSQTIQFPPFLVLASRTRTVSATWGSHPWMCACTVRLTATDGDGQTITLTTRVVIFPLWTILGILLAVAGLAVLRGTLRRRAKTRPSRHGRRRVLV
jgi:hypothetical protein